MTRKTDKKERENKRRMIMDAALKIFSKQGFSPAVLEEVAREAGIAKGTLYLYFQDKEDLFCSTILNVIDKLVALMKREINDTLSPVQILRDIAFLQLSFFSQNKDFFGIFQTLHNDLLLCSHKQLFRRLMERRQTLIDYEYELVERGKKQGLVRKDIDTEEVVACYEGMVMYSIKEMGCCEPHNRTLSLEKKIDALIKIFLQGVSTIEQQSEIVRSQIDKPNV
jgi:AcrR family transcriptional regulator